VNRLISLSFIISLIMFFSACSISPVNDDTLHAQISYADFDGIEAEVGKLAPDFKLPNGQGDLVELNSFRNNQAVMLLFYRGEWCPFCMDQLADYQSLLPELKKYNIQLLAISTDGLSAIENTRRKFVDDYIFLSDEYLQVTRLYGVGNVQKLPHPALFLINKEGVLKWYYASTDFKVRPTAEQVEKIIKQIYAEE
jgi:peroxiredoxin